MKRVDGQRADYVRQYYRKDWLDKSLYDLCINTEIGLDLAAELITTAICRSRTTEEPSAHRNQPPHSPAGRESDPLETNRTRTLQQ